MARHEDQLQSAWAHHVFRFCHFFAVFPVLFSVLHDALSLDCPFSPLAPIPSYFSPFGPMMQMMNGWPEPKTLFRHPLVQLDGMDGR